MPRLMKEYFVNDQELPLIIEPAKNHGTTSDLLSWINSNRAIFTEKFHKYGGVLFRGFEIDTPKDFESLAVCVDPKLENDYYGTSPRLPVQGTKYVFTASELPGYYPIAQHCEMSYVKHPPVSIFFYCHVEPSYGGESPICNFRKVYADMDPRIRKEFETRGIVTVRNYSGLHNKLPLNLFELKRWNEIFNTTDTKEVERQCKQQEIDFEWMPNGNLRLQHKTPAIITHPVTHEKAWFNHLQVFHPHGADTEYFHIHDRQKRTKTFLWKHFLKWMVKFKSLTIAPLNQSMNVVFGDGSPVPDSYVEHVQDIIWKNMVILPWRKNDVMAIDNFSTSHGRLPYEGDREILVCWSV